MSVYTSDLFEILQIPSKLKNNPFRMGMEWGAVWASHLDVEPQDSSDIQKTVFVVALEHFSRTFDTLFGQDQKLIKCKQNLYDESLRAWEQAFNTLVYDIDPSRPFNILPQFEGDARKFYRTLTGLGWNCEWGKGQWMPATAQLEGLWALSSNALNLLGPGHAEQFHLGAMTAFCWMALYLDPECAGEVFRVMEDKALHADFLTERLFARDAALELDTLRDAYAQILKCASEIPEYKRRVSDETCPTREYTLDLPELLDQFGTSAQKNNRNATLKKW